MCIRTTIILELTTKYETGSQAKPDCLHNFSVPFSNKFKYNTTVLEFWGSGVY